jgi:dUTP pyrophosphatase
VPSFKKGMKATLVKTGLKAYMQEDEVLYLFAKSSGFGKKGIMLSNAVGVIDGDYYGNEDNDGHIMFSIINMKEEDLHIKKGDAIGQAMFSKYLKADDDNATETRKGGFGSTSK